MVTRDQCRLLVLCAIRMDKQSPDWSVIARQLQRDRGLDLLYDGVVLEMSSAAEATRDVLSRGLEDLTDASARVDAELAAAASVGARLVTVMDTDYPANLRLVPDLPPFLFVRGEVRAEDLRSVAVVGTRNAKPEGLVRAAKMAQLLAEQDVTVVAGLARGIDTAAHTAALDAGGRTIAVLGTGITKCYPAENAGLAERIVSDGALVSQFWPSSSPATWTFPRRNVVTSGISQGTVVIEASSTSGAKMQARLALAHGKRVWLLRSLVTEQLWAQKYVATRGAVEIVDVAEVLRELAPVERIVEAVNTGHQLAMELG